MLLHKIIYQVLKDVDTPVGVEEHVKTHIKWVGSGKDAGMFRKIARQKYKYIPNSIKTIKIDVPTDKKGLIKFLNSDRVL